MGEKKIFENIFGNRLKSIREVLNLRQEEFCEHLNISPATYKNYENNTRIPGSEIVYYLYQEFDVDPTYFILGIGKMFMHQRPKLIKVAKFIKTDPAVKMLWDGILNSENTKEQEKLEDAISMIIVNQENVTEKSL